MRIIAGQYKGTRLASVGKGDPKAHLRPTTDRVRENLFNVLGNYLDWDGLRVLDLFAGTGALGFESLSRGAAHVTFVENGRAGGQLVAENIRLLGAADHTRLLRLDATRLPAGDTYDVVFLDPPYGKDLGQKALARAVGQGWLAPDALVVWEEDSAMYAPGFTVQDARKYGDTWISILSRDQ